MPASSRAGAAQDALVALLDADPQIDCPVTLGPPPGMVERDHVYISGQVQIRQDFGSLDQTVRDETFTLTIQILARRATYKEGRDRVLALLAEVEDRLRADSDLTDTVVWAQITGVQLADEVFEREHLASAEVQVSAMAALQA